ncbi:Fur family transcriptional regulator [Halomonas sp. A29]|uniref:Fur family transcriptional regulator n=1 Tax=Halomonas sp. A29 TaxID=3102786 RepID=UPI00398ADE32
MPLTDNQRHVLDALRNAEAPLGAYALLERLREDGFSAPTQVYRALEGLKRKGLVHRLETLNAYVPCSLECGEQAITAFVICDDCGCIDELIDKALSQSLGLLVKRRDFSPDSMTIEIHGTCARCAGLDDNATNPSSPR